MCEDSDPKIEYYLIAWLEGSGGVTVQGPYADEAEQCAKARERLDDGEIIICLDLVNSQPTVSVIDWPG